MYKLESYDLTQYKPTEIVIINEFIISIANNESGLLLFDLNQNKIIGKLGHCLILSIFNQNILTMDNQKLSLWDYTQFQMINTFPILRDYPSFSIINNEYVVISDMGYIGCRYYKYDKEQYIEKPRLKFDGKCIVNAKLDNNTLYTITLDGYLMIKNLKPNYRLKKNLIADKLLYGFDINDRYIFIVLLDKSIMVIDKNNLEKKRIFKAHKGFVKHILCHDSFVYSLENLLPDTTKEILIWDPDNLNVISQITCKESIKRFVIKKDKLFVFNKKSSILDIYQHNNFKDQKLYSF